MTKTALALVLFTCMGQATIVVARPAPGTGRAESHDGLAKAPAEYVAALDAATRDFSMLAAMPDAASVRERAARSLHDLAVAWPSLATVDAPVVLAAMRAEVTFLGPALLRGLVADTAPDAPLGVAMTEWHDAQRAVSEIRAGADGPDNVCFQQYWACQNYCATRESFADRAACGLDCTLDFAGCFGGALAGIQRIGPGTLGLNTP